MNSSDGPQATIDTSEAVNRPPRLGLRKANSIAASHHHTDAQRKPVEEKIWQCVVSRKRRSVLETERVGGSLSSRRRSEVFAGDSIKSQLNTRGNSQLFINVAEVISNRMLGESELLADFPGAQTFRKEMDHLRFPGGQTVHTAPSLDHLKRLELCEEIEDESQRLVGGPDLTFVHGSNALGQQFHGLDPAKNSSRAASEGIHDQIPFRFRNQHHCRCFRAEWVQGLEHVIPGQWSIVQSRIDQSDVRMDPFQFAQRFRGIIRDGDDADVMTSAPELVRDQMCAQAIGICDQDIDAAADRGR